MESIIATAKPQTDALLKEKNYVIVATMASVPPVKLPLRLSWKEQERKS